jgi:hypothetical protein
MDLSVGGVLTLDAQGNANAQWVFQVASALTINTGARVVIINGGYSQNVIWQVGASATIGTSAVMVGDIIAQSSVSLGTSATLAGRAIALTGAVTLLGNSMINPQGPPPPFPTPTVSFSSMPSVASLTELCFPDCTQKTLRAWGLVALTPGGYTVGGIHLGMFNFLDVRTVDVNGILHVEVYGEEPYGLYNTSVLPGFTYKYSPVNDALQIFYAGAELLANQTLPSGILLDTLLFETTVDRTTVRG